MEVGILHKRMMRTYIYLSRIMSQTVRDPGKVNGEQKISLVGEFCRRRTGSSGCLLGFHFQAVVKIKKYDKSALKRMLSLYFRREFGFFAELKMSANAWNDGSTDYFCGCEQPNPPTIGLTFHWIVADVSLHGGNEQQQRSPSFRDVMCSFVHIIRAILSDWVDRGSRSVALAVSTGGLEKIF